MGAELDKINYGKDKEKMKRFLTFIICSMILCTLTACGAESGQENSVQDNLAANTQESTKTEEMGTGISSEITTETDTGVAENLTEPDGGQKTLVVYFSVPETTKPDNMNAEEEYSTVVINGEVLGNTQYVAYVIQENTNADLFRIEPVTPYPMNHAELEEIATQEKRENAYPEISAQVDSMEQYDTVFIGYPNWYSDMPRILYSFFNDYDLSGKTVIPFVTSGGSGFSNTISTIEELEPEADVITDGFSVSRNTVQDAENDIIEWLKKIGY